MKRFILSMITAGLVFLIASPVGATTKAQVESRVLSISNMPTGWSVDDSTSSSSGSIPCLKSIKSRTKHQEKATVAYKDGSLPAVQEIIAAGEGVSASYMKLNHALANCKTFTYSSGGQKVTGNVGPLLFPTVGSHSNAYAITLSVQGANAGVDAVLFKTGSYVGAVLYESIGTPDLSQAEAFVNEAVSKVEGKTAVAI